ncbi:unnamed protein product, partial [Prorocentrum cordatum]
AARRVPWPDGRGPGGPASEAAETEDAPAGHAAWGKVLYEPSRATVRLYLKSLGLPGGVERYTTTAKACGGSAEEALRVARLCWVRFSEGATREEVNAYRQRLYDAIASRGAGAPAGEPPARRPAPRKAGHRAAAGRAGSPQGKAGAASSSSSSTSSDDAGEHTSGDEASSSAASGAAAPLAGPGAAAAPAAGARAARAAPQRACAKMLVRSGLRCVCHFALLRVFFQILFVGSGLLFHHRWTYTLLDLSVEATMRPWRGVATEAAASVGGDPEFAASSRQGALGAAGPSYLPPTVAALQPAPAAPPRTPSASAGGGSAPRGGGGAFLSMDAVSSYKRSWSIQESLDQHATLCRQKEVLEKLASDRLNMRRTQLEFARLEVEDSLERARAVSPADASDPS